ncbi:hypothetical protein HanRHA438_Chr10g0449951 [Helianthus annuus]|nr:hypothetical protein HanRHA438_Chr10g0449951 [Helianthus annuus]
MRSTPNLLPPFTTHHHHLPLQPIITFNQWRIQELFQWVRFGRFSLTFFKSYKVLTIFSIFLQTEWVHVNPQKRAGSSTAFNPPPPSLSSC